MKWKKPVKSMRKRPGMSQFHDLCHLFSLMYFAHSFYRIPTGFTSLIEAFIA